MKKWILPMLSLIVLVVVIISTTTGNHESSDNDHMVNNDDSLRQGNKAIADGASVEILFLSDNKVFIPIVDDTLGRIGSISITEPSCEYSISGRGTNRRMRVSFAAKCTTEGIVADIYKNIRFNILDADCVVVWSGVLLHSEDYECDDWWLINYTTPVLPIGSYWIWFEIP